MSKIPPEFREAAFQAIQIERQEVSGRKRGHGRARRKSHAGHAGKKEPTLDLAQERLQFVGLTPRQNEGAVVAEQTIAAGLETLRGERFIDSFAGTRDG